MFAEAIGNPDWALINLETGEPYTGSIDLYGADGTHKDVMDAYLIEWLMDHTKEEVFNLCFERRIPFIPVHTIEDVMKSPQFEARQYFVEIDHPEVGVLKYPGAPAKLSKTPWIIDHPAPLLGEHNVEVYCKRLGYSKEDLVKLTRIGVI